MARQRNLPRRPSPIDEGAPEPKRPTRVALVAALVSIGYVALVAARRADHVGLGGLALAMVALALGRTSARVRPRPLRWASWGAGIVVATLIASDETARAAACAGALVSSAAGATALTTLPSLGGIVRHRKRSPRLAIIALGILWMPGIVTLAQGLAGRPSLSPWFVAGSAVMSALALTMLAAALRLERHLELGVVERLNSFLTCTLGIGALATTVVLAGALDAARATCLASAGISLAACAMAELGDPVALWLSVRRASAMVMLAGLIAAAFGFLVIENRTHETWIMAGLVLLAVLAGAELPRIAAALRGGVGRRLAAASEAREALRGRDADVALGSVLQALRAAAPPHRREGAGPGQAGSPELWTLDPVRMLRVDAAGYAHDEPASLPPELAIVACGEPEATLRAEALRGVEVRRPDLRPLSRWMSDARMASATLIARGGDIEGVLFLPACDDAPDLTLEEARALRSLADDLAPLCHARAKLARSMARENEARVAENEATTRAERLEHQLARASAQYELAAARLARPAAVGMYSARSRVAYDALERLTKSQAPIVVVAKSGVDPVPFIARAHLAGARSGAPLVLVDGTSTREHDLEHWRDPIASPLALADGGLLVLLDAPALPTDVQRLIGQALAERRAPWERPEALDIVLAVTSVEDARVVAESGRLDPLLASRVASAIDDPVRLPGISERPEDIRAIVTDRLAREGLRARGTPVGIADAAFALLVDHPFEGEDSELAAIVQKLVARARADVVESAHGRTAQLRIVVRESDVRAVLFPAEVEQADHLAASAAAVISPKPSRRRP